MSGPFGSDPYYISEVLSVALKKLPDKPWYCTRVVFRGVPALLEEFEAEVKAWARRHGVAAHVENDRLFPGRFTVFLERLPLRHKEFSLGRVAGHCPDGGVGD